MPAWQLLLSNALLYGLALSLILGAIMTISLALAPTCGSAIIRRT